jgi:murein DD-endopeptidase / murein LD-carboxypeptidase
MKEIAQIAKDLLLLLSRLVWLILQSLVRWLGKALAYLYRHRIQITGHPVTPYVVLLLCTVWFLLSMQYRLNAPHSQIQTTPGQPTAYQPKPHQPDPRLVDEYQALTGSLPDAQADLHLIHTIYPWLGTPHCDGGSSLKGTDCSGFVQSVFQERYRVRLSRSAADMYEQDIVRVDREDLQEGDLVFFRIGSRSISHVGIYLKGDRFVHASTSQGVIVSSLQEPYYRKAYYRTGRVKNLVMWAFK